PGRSNLPPMDSFYEHPGLGFRLPLPAGWELLEDPRPGVSLVAAAPERPDVFRANLVVSIEAVNPGLDLETWQAEATAMLPGLLEDCLLLDQEVVDLPAGPAL